MAEEDPIKDFLCGSVLGPINDMFGCDPFGPVILSKSDIWDDILAGFEQTLEDVQASVCAGMSDIYDSYCAPVVI